MKPQWEEHSITCPTDLLEPVSAELFELGFEGVWEDGNLLHAYIPHANTKKEDLLGLCDKYGIDFSLWKIEPCEEINWNQEWEKNYHPIQVNNKLSIRAHFHTPSNTPLEIVITPKMSFGTGHHPTTFLMADHLTQYDLLNKDVLDMGCGTGILAILAKKLGAANVMAVDYDPNAIENTEENVKYNHCDNVKVISGSLEDVVGDKYDMIISNITRNINMSFVPEYAKMLNPGGTLMLSGFYTEDANKLIDVTNQYHLEFNQALEKENWSLLILTKK